MAADESSRFLRRVREDVSDLSKLVDKEANFPLHQYVDVSSINALCDTFELDSESWQGEDLERILIIRDGLYEIRNSLRDRGDSAEHSVDQLLSCVDRLYADLERALRETNPDDLIQAQSALTALQRGPHVGARNIPKIVEDLKAEANELLSQTHVTNHNIEITLIKIDRSSVNLEFLTKAKLSVQRFSASVFAIKLSLESNTIYQGVFRFLTNGADNIVEEIKRLASQFDDAYETASGFIAELSSLVEKGSRFTKLVGGLLKEVFDSEERPSHKTIDFQAISHHTSGALLASVSTSRNLLFLAGRQGLGCFVDPSTSKLVDERRVAESDVFGACQVDDEWIALATDEGLRLIAALGRERHSLQSSFHESLGAVTTFGGFIVTGSKDGILRQWTMAGNLSQKDSNSFIKLGRRIQTMLVHRKRLIIAANEDLCIVDEDLKERQRINTGFRINAIELLDESTLIACGKGRITHINLDNGIYERMIIESSAENYCCLRRISSNEFFIGTEDGRLVAVDFRSGRELGSVQTGTTLRGMEISGNRLVAYGGSWKTKGRSISYISWRAAADEGQMQ